MAAKSAKKIPQIGEEATFEVAVPHCGLEKGERRRMKVTAELLYCIEKGLWKVKK